MHLKANMILIIMRLIIMTNTTLILMTLGIITISIMTNMTQIKMTLSISAPDKAISAKRYPAI